MRNIPRAGEFYRHFKGKLYQIVAIARDSETLAQRVIYQGLYGSFQIYDRELSDFMSEVDREKYPDAEQEYRFEQVILEEEEGSRSIIPVKTTITQLYDAAGFHDISVEEHAAIENQRKEIEGQSRMHLEDHVKGALEDHVKGALEDHMGEADPDDVRYVDNKGNAFHSRKLTEDEVADGVDPRLMAFLDAETYTERLEIFNHMRDGITEKTLNDITAVLDISPTDGSLDEQYLSVKKDLETFARFERFKD